ncbi:hypothetical protein LTR53_002545 [Teratosphaeriaceae sp. CCFEE 6253]|nr:hypothetical protein LTR53_002545 [Teratosphaeriaceae sp. CCFEE 6253]
MSLAPAGPRADARLRLVRPALMPTRKSDTESPGFALRAKMHTFMQCAFDTPSSKTQSPPPIPSQTTSLPTEPSSPLFRLPRELRDLIWAAVLFRPPGSRRRAHFHIYKCVIDSCTYAPELNRERALALSTALLRTSKAIHDEAAQVLYADIKFELIVFAGLPRPLKAYCLVTPGAYSDLCDRNRFASIADFRYWHLMRHVSLTLQPGRFPHGNKYAKRVTSVIQALRGGAHLRTLRIHFDVCRTTLKPFHADTIKAFKLSIAALTKHIVAVDPAARSTTLALVDGLQAQDPGYEDRLAKLRAALGYQDAQPVATLTAVGGKAVGRCERRGAFGDPIWQAQAPPSRLDRVKSGLANVVMATLGAPILAPAMLIAAGDLVIEVFRSLARDVSPGVRR